MMASPGGEPNILWTNLEKEWCEHGPQQTIVRLLAYRLPSFSGMSLGYRLFVRQDRISRNVRSRKRQLPFCLRLHRPDSDSYATTLPFSRNRSMHAACCRP